MAIIEPAIEYEVSSNLTYIEAISILKKRKKRKGVFMLGRINPQTGKFRPRYVGSSFTDLIMEILSSAKRIKNNTFNRVKHEYTSTDIGAWRLECDWYHRLLGRNNLTNDKHPKRPDDRTPQDLPCPRKWCEL